MVNSTAVGGGVAELLRGSLPYWLGADLDARWAVVQARPEFFRITKRIHNMLHGHAGDEGELGWRERRVYEASLAPTAVWLERRVHARDIVVLHDPQTAGLAPALKRTGAYVVFRSHVGADHPNALVQAAWDFLLPYVSYADAIVFTRPSSAPLWLESLPSSGHRSLHRSVRDEEQAMDDRAARAILTRAGLAEGSLGPVGRPAFRRRDGSEGHVARPCLFAERVGRCGSTSIPSSCTSLAGIA